MLDFGFYNMDCMEGMRQFPDKYFDLAIVDPPYGDASENVGGVEQIRSEVRQVQASTDNQRIVGNQTEHGVIRVGGTWASKYRKKLSSGMWPPKKSILMNSFASHAIRLYGGGTTLICHQHAVF